MSIIAETASIASILAPAVSGAFGGIIGLVPKFIDVWKRKQENAHELALLDKQAELQRAENETKIAIAAEQTASAVAEGTLKLADTAMKKAAPWVATLSASVRPVTTYYFLTLHACMKVAMWRSLSAGTDLAAHEIMLALWTAPDQHIMNFVLAFWFVNRERRR